MIQIRPRSPMTPLRAVPRGVGPAAAVSPARGLRVAMVAPPWIAVPPAGYGGIEAVVAPLCDALVRDGHDVTLFAAPGSRSSAEVRAVLDAAHPAEIGSALHESDHVGAVWDAIDDAAREGEPFDIVHDHSGFSAVAMASRVAAPVVHTLHGAFDEPSARFYSRHGHKATLVAISRSQAASAPDGVRIAGIVPNPIVAADWPFSDAKDDYLLWIGRMDPVKAPHLAIAAARHAGRRLVLAGPVQTGQSGYFRERVLPHVDGDRVRYVGEAGPAAKRALYRRAAAMLMPITWQEPFGMVMVESLACGTPVIAFPRGAASEIVIDGVNGRLVANELEMARAVADLDAIDPAACRRSVETRYGVASAAREYAAIYEEAIADASTVGMGSRAAAYA